MFDNYTTKEYKNTSLSGFGRASTQCFSPFPINRRSRNVLATSSRVCLTILPKGTASEAISLRLFGGLFSERTLSADFCFLVKLAKKGKTMGVGFHFDHTDVSRGSGKASGASKYSYISRVNEHERKEDPSLLDVSRLPPEYDSSTTKGALEFWQDGDKHERANARLYDQIIVAFPSFFNLQQQQQVLEEYIQDIIPDQAYSYAIHEGKGNNPHAHLMFSHRVVDGIKREKGKFFKRAKKDAPERGGGAKNQKLQEREMMNVWRKSWEHSLNNALEREGYEFRVSADSCEKRGIAKMPQPMPRYMKEELKRAGIWDGKIPTGIKWTAAKLTNREKSFFKSEKMTALANKKWKKEIKTTKIEHGKRIVVQEDLVDFWVKKINSDIERQIIEKEMSKDELVAIHGQHEQTVNDTKQSNQRIDGNKQSLHRINEELKRDPERSRRKVRLTRSRSETIASTIARRIERRRQQRRNRRVGIAQKIGNGIEQTLGLCDSIAEKCNSIGRRLLKSSKIIADARESIRGLQKGVRELKKPFRGLLVRFKESNIQKGIQSIEEAHRAKSKQTKALASNHATQGRDVVEGNRKEIDTFESEFMWSAKKTAILKKLIDPRKDIDSIEKEPFKEFRETFDKNHQKYLDMRKESKKIKFDFSKEFLKDKKIDRGNDQGIGR